MKIKKLSLLFLSITLLTTVYGAEHPYSPTDLDALLEEFDAELIGLTDAPDKRNKADALGESYDEVSEELSYIAHEANRSIDNISRGLSSVTLGRVSGGTTSVVFETAQRASTRSAYAQEYNRRQEAQGRIPVITPAPKEIKRPIKRSSSAANSRDRKKSAPTSVVTPPKFISTAEHDLKAIEATMELEPREEL